MVGAAKELINPYRVKGDLALLYAVRTNDQLMDFCGEAAKVGVGLAAISEIGRFGLEKFGMKVEPKVSWGLRLASGAVILAGLIGKKYFDRQADLAAEEVGDRALMGNKRISAYLEGKTAREDRMNLFE